MNIRKPGIIIFIVLAAALSAMKDLWHYYSYLRRWGLLLLLGLLLGALAGLGFAFQRDTPKFRATVTVVVGGDLTFKAVSNFETTPQAAAKAMSKIVSRLDTHTDIPIVLQGPSIERRSETVWWKPILLGSVFGGLLFVGGAYFWEDARSYQRHCHQNRTRDSSPNLRGHN